MNTDISRLRWSCRRGMLELDIILQKFLEQAYHHIPENEKILFIELLDCTDQDLYKWLTGKSKSDNPNHQYLIDKMREHAKNSAQS